MSIRIYQRPGSRVWYLRGTVRGIRVFETTRTDRRDIAEAIRTKREAALLEESVFGKKAVVSFGRAALSYLEFEERSACTVRHVDRLLAHFGDGILLANLGQEEADRAVAAILKGDAAPATKRRAVYAPLSAILNHAHRRGWCSPPKFDMPRLPPGKTRWLTPAEVLRLVAAAAPHLRPLLLFLVCTGARMSEALRLPWCEVDLPAKSAAFRHTKNRGDRVATLVQAATAILASLPTDEHGVRSGRVFRRHDGEPYAIRKGQSGGEITTAWRTACRRANLGEWRQVNGKQVFVPKFTPHDLRHTWATWFYALTKDLLLLKAEGGWRSASMVERYAHLMPSSLVADISLVWGLSHPRIAALNARKFSAVES